MIDIKHVPQIENQEEIIWPRLPQDIESLNKNWKN